METTAIWNQFSDAIKRFFISRVTNDALAEDLLQEVFIKIHLKSHQLLHQKNLKSWIFTIAKNVLIDYYKKEANKFSQSLFELKSEDPSNLEHSARDCVRPLINNLPEKYKETMMLSEVQGLKQSQVAELLNISLSAAKSRIQRGRALLKKGFMSCCDYKLNEYGHLIGEHKDIEDCKICNPLH